MPVGAGVTKTSADFELSGLETEVATMNTPGLKDFGGAVYFPVASIVPHPAPEQFTSGDGITDQVTPSLSESFLTVAVNCTENPTSTDVAFGETAVTAASGGGAVGGGVTGADGSPFVDPEDVPPHPSWADKITTMNTVRIPVTANARFMYFPLVDLKADARRPRRGPMSQNTRDETIDEA